MYARRYHKHTVSTDESLDCEAGYYFNDRINRTTAMRHLSGGGGEIYLKAISVYAHTSRSRLNDFIDIAKKNNKLNTLSTYRF